MLLKTIQADSLAARRARDTVRATLLTTLYSEAAMVGKNDGNRDSTDDEVIKVIRKFVKGIDESLAVKTEGPAAEALRTEKALLEAYLPVQVTEADVEAAAHGIVASLEQRGPKAMGAVMKALKDRFGAALDGQVASAVVKRVLAAA